MGVQFDKDGWRENNGVALGVGIASSKDINDDSLPFARANNVEIGNKGVVLGVGIASSKDSNDDSPTFSRVNNVEIGNNGVTSGVGVVSCKNSDDSPTFSRDKALHKEDAGSSLVVGGDK